jgi:hypothetical protein
VAKTKIEGTCHICGDYGELSDEHIPPRNAFNDGRYFEVDFKESIHFGPEYVPTKQDGRLRQGGIRFPTLCRNCNSDLGGWYGREFVDWCHKGMFILTETGGPPNGFCVVDVYPSRIIKHVATMFFSVNNNEFRLTERGADLVRILKNRDRRGLPDGFRFFTYFNREGQPRHNAISALADLYGGTIRVISEITYPPFGYVMMIDSEPPDPRLYEITDWAWCDHDDKRMVCLELPVLATHLNWFSGDYRTVEEIRRR